MRGAVAAGVQSYIKDAALGCETIPESDLHLRGLWGPSQIQDPRGHLVRASWVSQAP